MHHQPATPASPPTTPTPRKVCESHFHRQRRRSRRRHRSRRQWLAAHGALASRAVGRRLGPQALLAVAVQLVAARRERDHVVRVGAQIALANGAHARWRVARDRQPRARTERRRDLLERALELRARERRKVLAAQFCRDGLQYAEVHAAKAHRERLQSVTRVRIADVVGELVAQRRVSRVTVREEQQRWLPHVKAVARQHFVGDAQARGVVDAAGAVANASVGRLADRHGLVLDHAARVERHDRHHVLGHALRQPVLHVLVHSRHEVGSRRDAHRSRADVVVLVASHDVRALKLLAVHVREPVVRSPQWRWERRVPRVQHAEARHALLPVGVHRVVALERALENSAGYQRLEILVLIG